LNLTPYSSGLRSASMVGISSALMNQESSTTYYEDFMPP
jgi:hypothetical protein